jgi:hypothetical protein
MLVELGVARRHAVAVTALTGALVALGVRGHEAEHAHDPTCMAFSLHDATSSPGWRLTLTDWYETFELHDGGVRWSSAGRGDDPRSAVAHELALTAEDLAAIRDIDDEDCVTRSERGAAYWLLVSDHPAQAGRIYESSAGGERLATVLARAAHRELAKLGAITMHAIVRYDEDTFDFTLQDHQLTIASRTGRLLHKEQLSDLDLVHVVDVLVALPRQDGGYLTGLLTVGGHQMELSRFEPYEIPVLYHALDSADLSKYLCERYQQCAPK